MPADKPQQNSQPPKSNGPEIINPQSAHSLLQKMVPEMQAALPRHITGERMARLCFTTLKQNPKLFNSTKESFLGSIMTACQLGLEPGVMGQCWIIPYWNAKSKLLIATFVPGWKGLLDLVKRTERGTASSKAVYDGDEFDYEYGDKPFVHHKPGKNYGTPEAMQFTYAVGWTNGSEWPEIDVWDVDRIWKHRNKMNKVGDSHYSYAYPEQYARKIPLLQVIKYLPTSIELATAISLDGSASDQRQLLPSTGALSNIIDVRDIQEAEIEQHMENLGWDAQKRDSFREQYAGRAEDALGYLKSQSSRGGKVAPDKKSAEGGAVVVQPTEKTQEQQPAQESKPAQVQNAEPQGGQADEFWK